MPGTRFELGELGNLRVGAEPFGADHELGVAFRKFGQHFSDHPASGILGGRDREQELHLARIFLGEPTSQARLGMLIESLSGL